MVIGRIWRYLTRPVTNVFYQRKAIKHMEKLDDMTAARRAPRYPSEQKHYEEVRKDKKITEELNKRDADLIDNVNKIKIHSTGASQRWTSAKQLTSHDCEWIHRNDSIWEYGFYEPPNEKMPKGKLKFREAIEVMRIMSDMQYISKLDDERKHTLLPQVQQSLEKHAAVERINKEDLDNMWTYFRPFERKTEQVVVKDYIVEDVKDAMIGLSRKRILPSFGELISSAKKIFARKRLAELPPETVESERMRLGKVQAIREAEEDRLERLLQNHKLKDTETGDQPKQIDEDVKKRQMKQLK